MLHNKLDMKKAKIYLVIIVLCVCILVCFDPFRDRNIINEFSVILHYISGGCADGIGAFSIDIYRKGSYPVVSDSSYAFSCGILRLLDFRHKDRVDRIILFEPKIHHGVVELYSTVLIDFEIMDSVDSSCDHNDVYLELRNTKISERFTVIQPKQKYYLHYD